MFCDYYGINMCSMKSFILVFFSFLGQIDCEDAYKKGHKMNHFMSFFGKLSAVDRTE